MKDEKENEDKLSKMYTSELYGDTSKKQFEKICKQFKDLDFGKISALDTSMLGIAGTIGQFQKNWSKQFKNLDFGKISALNISMLGIAGTMEQFQNNWSKQFKDLDFGKISALDTSMLGIAGTMGQFQKNWSKQFKDLDFSKIKIDQSGTIDYLDETINIKDVVEDVNSYLLEDKSTEQEVEQNTEYLEKLNAIMNIILFIFLFVLIISIQPKSSSLSLPHISNEQQIAENIQELSENIEQGLDEMAKLMLFLSALPNKWRGRIDDIAKENPGQFEIVFIVIPYIMERIYKVAKKRKESITFSREILNDRKRIIKSIKRQIEISIKDEFKSEIVGKIFHRNFGVVNQKSLNVRISNNIKSPIIYKLSLGEIVTIIEKNQKWINIQFVGKDDCNYMGWVVTSC